jgi:hypothetical protein
MPTMLRQKDTGDLYVFTPIMATRPDMEVLDEPDISPVAEPPKQTKPRKAKAAKKEADDSSAPEPAKDVKSLEEDLASAFNTGG